MSCSFSVSVVRHALRQLPLALDLGVELGPDQHGHEGQPEPAHQHDGRGEGPVDRAHVGDLRHVGRQAVGHQQPDQHAHHGSGRQPVEGALLDVRGDVVDEVEREHGRGHRPGPADDAPYLCGRWAEPGEIEQVVGEPAAHEHHDQAGDHEGHQHDGGHDVDGLALEEAAAGVHLEDHVERAPGRLQHAGGAVEGHQHADDQRGGRRPLVLERSPQRPVQRLDHRLGRHVLEVVDDRVVGLGVLADQAQQREAQQRGRKQRHEPVVGECRGVMGHLVVVERHRGPLDDPVEAAHGERAGA